MSSAPKWTYRHATELRNHWWWRPGWQVGTRFYAWHLTFEDATAFGRLADCWQARLAEFDVLDLIPRRWLHLTMQGVGMVEDVPDSSRDAIVRAVRRRLVGLPSVRVRFTRPVVRPEAIALPAIPVNRVQALRMAVRVGMADAIGPDVVPEMARGFQPHVSLAYVNQDAAAAPIAEAIDCLPSPERATVAVTRASLIELHRDNRMYEWRTIANASIGDMSPV